VPHDLDKHGFSGSALWHRGIPAQRDSSPASTWFGKSIWCYRVHKGLCCHISLPGQQSLPRGHLHLWVDSC